MLTHLALRNFRNFRDLDLEVPGSGLVIVGDNGHGKTNLLESVACLSLMRSFRGARDGDLIRFGENAFSIRANELAPARYNTVTLGYERTSKRKRVSLDGVEQSKLSSALGALPSVVFSPTDVSLVSGGPSERRRFLDVMLALSSADYLRALQVYRHALTQRNAILKAAHTGGLHHADTEAQISAWEPALANSGGLITLARWSFVAKYRKRYAVLCANMGETLPARVRYSGADGIDDGIDDGIGDVADGAVNGIVDGTVDERVADDAVADCGNLQTQNVQTPNAQTPNAQTQCDLLLKEFERQRQREIRRGVTLVGPHRDDMLLTLGSRDLRVFGSAGQQRSAAIALRLLELTVLRDALGYSPLLLLDDPFAELDSGRAARVLHLMDECGVEQVLLTVPRISDIPSVFRRLEHRTICEGVVS